MKKIEGKKDIIFDFDGTIADSLNEILEISHKLINKKHNLTKKEIKYLIRNKTPETILKKYSISKIKFYIGLFFARKKLLKKVDKIKIFPHTKETLIYLKQKNYTLGIVSSNNKKIIKKILKNNNIEQYFTNYIFRAKMYKKEKALLKYIKKFSKNKKTSIYIADEIKDIQASNNINLDIISVSYGFNSKTLLKTKQPKIIIDNINELKNLF